MTQREFADKIGVSGQAVGQWERGASEPTYGHLRRIEAVLAGEEVDTISQLHALLEAQRLVIEELAATAEDNAEQIVALESRLAALEAVLGQRQAP